MRRPDIHPREIERLQALNSYNLLDTLPEQDYDDITRIASEICQTPISIITIIDKDRQWFKSKHGIEANETPREYAFCAHAILQPDETLVVSDTHQDDRFHDNPLVVGEPNIRFYAGVPLVNPEGLPLGTLCVVDHVKRQLAPHQETALKALANQIVAKFELRRKNEELHQSKLALEEANRTLENFAQHAAHDLKNPLNNIIALLGLLERNLPPTSSEQIQQIIHHLDSSANHLKELIDGILEFARLSGMAVLEQDKVDVKQLMEEILFVVTVPPNFRIDYEDVPDFVVTSHTALRHILSNLCTNAIKYNDKEQGYIKLTASENATHYFFQLQDNGTGIPAEALSKIFDMFTTLGKKDRFDQHGTGLGLALAKKLVEKSGGTIDVSSRVGEGTTFEFTLPKDN